MDLDTLIRPLLLPDLRILLRQRGCSPAGGQEEMRQRLKENMMATGNYSISTDGSGPAPVYAGASTANMTSGSLCNNYSRPGGMQNVGNFLTDKPSSRVLAPPGGGSQISFGDYVNPHTQMSSNGGQHQQTYQQGPPQYQQMQQPPPQMYQQMQQPPPQYQQMPPQQYRQEGPPPPGYGPPQGNVMFGASSNDVRGGTLSNNYARPGGQQNVGNFLTDRPSSRVLAPPGGKSQISFG